MGLLGEMAVLFPVFSEISTLFSIAAVLVCIPTNGVRGFPFISLFLMGRKNHVRSFLKHSDFILERIRQHMSNHFEKIHISFLLSLMMTSHNTTE